MGLVQEWTLADGPTGNARLSCQVLCCSGAGLVREAKVPAASSGCAGFSGGQGWAGGEQVCSLERLALSPEYHLGGLL